MKRTCLAILIAGILIALGVLQVGPRGGRAQRVDGVVPLPPLRPGGARVIGSRAVGAGSSLTTSALRVICRNAATSGLLAGALVERLGSDVTQVTGQDGTTVLEGCRPGDEVVVERLGFHGRRITISAADHDTLEVRLETLDESDLVHLLGRVVVHEELRRPPLLWLVAPTVIKRGVHRGEGERTLRRHAWMPRIRVPLVPEGAGLFRFDARVPPRGPLTLGTRGRGVARDPDGTYRGDDVYVDLAVYEEGLLEEAVRKGRSITCELVLQREAQVIELRVSDGGDRPLGRPENLVVSAQHHDLGPAGVNFNVVVAAEGSVVRFYGLPQVTRLVVQASGFEPHVLPVGASSFADHVEAPAFLDVRLRRLEQEREEAVILAVLDTEQKATPELAVLDAGRGQLVRTPFSREDSGLWTVSARHRPGGPFEVLVLLEHGTVHQDGLMLVAGENRLDLPPPGGATVSGRVLLRGAPLDGASVAWMRAGCHLRHATTDERGRFRLDGVLGGALTLRVTHTGRRLRRTFNARTGAGLVLELAPQ